MKSAVHCSTTPIDQSGQRERPRNGWGSSRPPGAHSETGQWQGPLPPGCQGVNPGFRHGRAPVRNMPVFGTTWGSYAPRAGLAQGARGARPEEELELASRQIVSRAVVSDGIIDISAAAGLDKPDISVLSDWPRCGGCPTGTSRWICGKS